MQWPQRFNEEAWLVIKEALEGQSFGPWIHAAKRGSVFRARKHPPAVQPKIKGQLESHTGFNILVDMNEEIRGDDKGLVWLLQVGAEWSPLGTLQIIYSYMGLTHKIQVPQA